MKLREVLHQKIKTVRVSESIGLGVFDHSDFDPGVDLDMVKFKAFVKKATTILNAYGEEDYPEAQRVVNDKKTKYGPATTRMIRNITADINDFNEAKDKQDPLGMESALSSAKQHYVELQRQVDLECLDEGIVFEAVKFKDCAEMLKSFMANMRRVREDLENTKGSDDIDDALDYFDSVMKQFENAQVEK